ncbi:MAG TPA: DUF1592 domain-containing protein [Polyangiaceae bacterium]|nr:DUF1592 domain-containing protein [Polyangiaceae bacterium]
MLALTGACVSGSLANGTNQHGSNGSQAGGDSQSPGGGQTPGGNGQQPGGGSTGSGSNGNGSTAQAPTALPAEQDCTSNSPGPRLMRRLTAAEFAASIADLFGDKTAPVAQVFNDSRVLGFTVDADTLRVQDLNADQLMTNAEAVANWAVTTDAQLSKLKQLATCSSHDTNCAKLFIKNFGRKAFRTAIPDGDARLTSYSDLFMAEADFTTGVSTVIAAMLQSPYFLYRSEIGAKGDQGPTFELTPYEVASSLSYLLTGSMPDDTLLKAADAVSAGDKNGLTNLVKDQAARLLAPSGADPLAPAAQDALMNFMSGWLGLDRLYTNVKDANALTDAQRADMATETKKFILDIWGASSGNTVGDLFSANYTFMNQNLASYYGVNPSGVSSSFGKVTLSSGRDPGILGQASILIGYSRSDSSSPTQRGHLVRSRLLCQDVPMPPAGLDTKFTPMSGLKTTRDQYLQGHAAPDHQPCYGCHKSMDPIGVAFEHYDQFGKYRSTENGVTIDATGTIYGASDGDIALDGLTGEHGLQTYLAQSDAVKSCLVRYWSYYAFGSASWSQDKCTYDSIRGEAAKESYSLKSVLNAILSSPRFTARVMDQ